MRGVAALAPAAALACWCSAAQAYRPFDGTDAAVAAPGEMEIELGPVEYLREGSERALFAPKPAKPEPNRRAKTKLILGRAGNFG